jgi:amino acid adenylation domain-containing protein/non-ribosomal peptide synthase protein (TIGR01720 family)/FkbM family methyltransferase
MQSVEGFRLSPQQKRLWQLQADGSAAYRAQGVVLIDGPLQPAALAAALQQVVDQHEILRTSFHCLPGTELPVQVIAEQAAAIYHSYDLSDRAPDEQTAQLTALLDQLGEQHRDLEASTLLRSALATLGPDRHALLLSLPALCADAATMRNLARAIGQAYVEQQSGAADEQELTQYADVAELFNELLESEDTAVGRAYWSARDLSALPAQALPFERAVSRASFAPQRLRLDLAPELAAQLATCAQSADVSVEICALACWQIMLARLTGEPALVVGATYDGRTYEGLDEALGLFARYAPVSARLADDASFAALLQQTARASQDVAEFQEYFAWELLSGKLAADQRFFPFCFDFTSAPATFDAGDVRFSLAQQQVCLDRFKLRLACAAQDETLRIELYYDPALYDAAEIARLAERFLTLAAAVTATPDAPVGAVAMVGPAERRLLVETLNATAAPYDRATTIHQLFEAQAARTPDALAAAYEDRRLTYAELNARANQLARTLRERGVEPETPVALCIERSPELIVAVLGILKAGGAYVPIDPAYPAERLRLMLQDSQARALIVDRRDRVAALDLQTLHPTPSLIDLQSDGPQIARAAAENLGLEISAEQMAYVIYTSGSTGTPKGVVVQHCSAINLARGLDQTIYEPLGEPLRVSLNGPLAFDTSVKQLIQLLHGHALVVVPEDLRLDPDGLAAYLREQQVDVLDCTPSLLKQLLGDGRRDRLGAHPGRVLIGGEAIDEALWQTLAADDRRQFYNLYGPTECTVDATIARIDRADSTPTIGRPIANVATYILDERMQPTPFGVAGELYIGGAGLARGYLNRPALTAERFTPHPFTDQPGSRLYKTGDLARYRSDGSLEYLGRIDQQVKVRGYRVELGEIEAVLSQHPAVQNAAVTMRADQSDHERLIAYVVPDQRAAFTVQQLMRLERERQLDPRSIYELPNAMVMAHLNKNETEFLYSEIFEQQTYLRHGVTLGDGACVFDIGANIGMFSLFVGRHSPGATVYAFEPIPPVFEVLRTNAQLYDLNLVPLHYGLADAPGEATFTYYAHASTLSSRYVDADAERAVIRSLVLTQDRADDTTEALDEALLDEVIAERMTSERFACPITTISEMIRRYDVQRIDLLKIDAQKSELDVLAGIQTEDWPKIRQIVLEVHDIEGRVERIRGLLERAGFQVTVEQEQALAETMLHNLYARRPDQPQLAASVAAPEAQWFSPARLSGDLRRYAGERLPDYMVPAAFVLLPALPLTTNGKLDRAALPAPEQSRPGSEQTFVAPRTPTEERLSRIWAEILRLERVGIHDNFFELGGDSILCIQVVARANQAGMHLIPRQLFAHQTIAELAAVADDGAPAQPDATEREPTSGPLPLLPIQRWFFEQDWPDLHAWNQTIELELREPIAPALLEQVIMHLLRRHDALRLRLVRDDQGWRQEIAEPPAQTPFTALDLSALPEQEQDRAAAQAAADLSARLDLAAGVLLHAALIDRGPQRPNLLLLATHALAVDGFSRRILAEDLQTASAQLRDGAAIELPPVTTSLRRWAETLTRYAESDELAQELDYWLSLDAPTAELPLDVPDASGASDDAQTVVVSLDAETTRALLQDVPAAYRTEINDVLLTALAQAFQGWTGQPGLLLDLRGHGREPLGDDIDLSRTVGWLTSIFPVRLDLDAADQPGPALLRIKEQLRRVPNHGLGYGVLRYLGDERSASWLRALPQAAISFNYLGQFDQVLAESAFALAPAQNDPSGGLWSPRYPLEIQGGVTGGQLRLAWKYRASLHRRATIEQLAHSFERALLALIEHCQSPEAGGYSPSDFPLVDLNQQSLDAILAQLRKAQG